MEHAKPYVIVVGVDYSKASDLALARAFEVATERQHAEVHIVHVMQTFGVGPALEPIEFGVASAPDPRQLSDVSEQLRLYADKRLQEFRSVMAERKKTKLFERAVSHVRLDSAVHEIAQLAADLEADLVIVGTHGRRGAARLLLGSVAEGVVRHAPCPVLVVRDKSVESPGPKIEPACPRCLEARRASAGKEFWCAQHSERHGRRHTYHQVDRVGSDGQFPLVVPETRG